jgi:hypothetical protein
VPIRIYTNNEFLDNRLQELGDKAINRISRNAVRRGLTVLRQAMQAAVPAMAKTKGHQTQTIKQAIGQSLKKSQVTTVTEGKAGAAVGVKRAASIAAAKAGRGDRKGVGISANNIHWYILGTGTRYTKKRGKRFTGRMPAEAAIRRGAGNAMGRVHQTIYDSVKNQVAKEWGAARGN